MSEAESGFTTDDGGDAQLNSNAGDGFLAQNEPPLEEDLLSIAKVIIGRLYGEHARALLEHLAENDYVAEEKIAGTLEFRSNEARKILQKLSDEAIVIPDKVRVENEVLHIWRLNKPALKTFVLNRLKRAREKLEVLLKGESENVIYECRSCRRRFLLDDAYAYGFQCPHDGEVLVEVNNPTSLRTIKGIIKKLDILILRIERTKSA
ncbi:MAG: transcription factor TFIIE [Desulfurococcaceae archaeon]